MDSLSMSMPVSTDDAMQLLAPTDDPESSQALPVSMSAVELHPATPPLFLEYYDTWNAFDHAIQHALDAHHPLRKRSSLTFDVYNRTVSKGRHNRAPIAEFLSKTYKCTHGIKFRARGAGKRLRHKLRDIGCPFHVYASAVEWGDAYRVKVRVNAMHNHPIGPELTPELSKPQASSSKTQSSSPTSSLRPVDNTGISVETTTTTTMADADMHDSNSVLGTRTHDDAELMEETALTGLDAAAITSTEFEETTTLEGLRQTIAQFAAERDWDQFHTPRNLTLALTGEVGELCECFQWKGDQDRVENWTDEERVHLGEEMSDVLIYLIRLADKCNINLPVAAHDKILKNGRKYPADQVRGSSKKYTEYKRPRNDEGEASL